MTKKERRHIYYLTHKEQERSGHCAYYAEHGDQIRAYSRQYYQDHKEEKSAKDREYNRTHQDIRRANRALRRDRLNATNRKFRAEKRKNDPSFRLSSNFGSRMANSLRGRGSAKGLITWQTLAGYTLDDLRRHLEGKFQTGMTWDNYGEWHIDHIRPQSSFNFTSYDDQEFKECWSLNNLQPLWAIDNCRKHNKWTDRKSA
jgi:hypothetical protein